MDQAEKCCFCGRETPEADLVAWFVQDERRATHTTCWLASYRSERPQQLLATVHPVREHDAVAILP